jgi:hypothetical protein
VAEPDQQPDLRLSPTPEDAERRLQRLADRLRVMGPRLAGRGSAEAEATLAQVRAGLQRLADLAAEAEGQPRRVVPELGPHALADQALVLGHDLLDRPNERPDTFRVAAVDAIDAVYTLL